MVAIEYAIMNDIYDEYIEMHPATEGFGRDLFQKIWQKILSIIKAIKEKIGSILSKSKRRSNEEEEIPPSPMVQSLDKIFSSMRDCIAKIQRALAPSSATVESAQTDASTKMGLRQKILLNELNDLTKPNVIESVEESYRISDHLIQTCNKIVDTYDVTEGQRVFFDKRFIRELKKMYKDEDLALKYIEFIYKKYTKYGYALPPDKSEQMMSTLNTLRSTVENLDKAIAMIKSMM